ncbi:MAG: hypothetical protein IPN34_17535 [Planctomycetes bacterium]|nr:hypothetical protein [Planctomycetota bacterium]
MTNVGPASRERAVKIAALLREELSRHLPVDKTIASFGQVDACVRREQGQLFPLRDHLRGMILAMLSANRPWKPIANNMARLAEIFGGFKPSFLENTPAESLEASVKAIGCGNRRVSFQMRAIQPNIATFRRLDSDAGTIDAFVADQPIETVVRELGAGRYKLRELGPTLVLEYLKNVGIRANKPDVHVLRICGPSRLGILSADASPLTAFHEFRAFANAAGMHEVELDNQIWLLGAEEYASICGATPKCAACALRSVCRQNQAT